MKMISELRKKIDLMLKSEYFQRSKPLLILTFIFLSYTGIRSYERRLRILDNPVEIYADIEKVVPCFKNGKCIIITYDFEGKHYTQRPSVDHGFANWCKKRDNCRGQKVRIEVNKNNPDEFLIFWQELMEE